ncbi:MAG: monovalent cation/H(+) antiporter subunit G [Acidobacteriota bacterium]
MTSLPSWLEAVAAGATLLGAFFFLASAIGLVRLPDFYSRVHAPTKAATLGVALLVIASSIRSLPSGNLVWIEDLLIVAFLFLTVPVSSQVLLRAAATRKVPQVSSTTGEPANAHDGASAGSEDGRTDELAAPDRAG